MFEKSQTAAFVLILLTLLFGMTINCSVLPRTFGRDGVAPGGPIINELKLNIKSVLSWANRRGICSPPEFTWHYTVAPTAISFLNSDNLGKKFENELFVGDTEFGNIYHYDMNQDRTHPNLMMYCQIK